MPGPDGRIGHVEVEVGEAVTSGGRVVTRPTHLAFGERVARVRDPQGHLWWIHQHVEDVATQDLGARLADPSAQEAMNYVQQSLTHELSDRP